MRVILPRKHGKYTMIRLVYLVLTFGLTSSQLMPGSVPQLPNPALKVCLNEIGYDNVTDKFNNRFANAVNRWCEVYDKALPCIDEMLSDSEDAFVAGPADWYFSMVYDTGSANITSQAMCRKLPKIGNKLTCMRSNVRRALNCVLKMTKTVKRALMRLYMNNDTGAAVAERGACLMSAATAECFKATMTECPRYIRNFIGAYHIILGGKCLKSMYAVDDTTPDPTESDEAEADKKWMSTVESKLESEIKVTLDPLISKDDKSSILSTVPKSQVVKTVLSSPTATEEEEREMYGGDAGSDSIEETQTTSASHAPVQHTSTVIPTMRNKGTRPQGNTQPRNSANNLDMLKYIFLLPILIFSIFLK